ncbi:MAG: His-Xaa-Ser system radical SAM maturase HxsC [Labilithrix sp.]|nr:His-Xaa-Ser system radical SAM maturase HxsC [Labilithrix sp.]
MLLKLHGRHLRPVAEASPEPFIGRISERPDLPEPARAREILLLRRRPESLPLGFRAYLLHEPPLECARRDVYVLGEEMRYLEHGDVVRIDPQRSHVNALYRRSSPSNSLLVTERCDNYCLMCSQPPRADDDRWIVDELRQVIPLLSPETAEIGITGGEPALLGQQLVELVELLKRHVPRTTVHILSNGRRFASPDLARDIGRVRHGDLMIGIPLYSDVPEDHDYVVQARGAFSETVRGVLNLKRYGIRVEIRVVLHAQTYARLPELARFLTRNLLFVDHVALMGLELMGFAKTNLEELWVDPLDYQQQLAEAVAILSHAGMVVSIYNHQLCVLRPELHGFARKSISDWKNTYFEECTGCAKRSACGGFFASSTLRRSRGIAPVGEGDRQTDGMPRAATEVAPDPPAVSGGA